jgi:hypothetical protein
MSRSVAVTSLIAFAALALHACAESPIVEPEAGGAAARAMTAVFTAANGDQLVTTFTGMATFPDQNGIVTFDGTDTVAGGTGRFADASGSFTRATRVNMFLGTGQLVLDGTLSY